MSENSSVKSNSVVTEAPASWNTKYVTPDGFVCQLTLRGETGKDLLEKANAALAWLRDGGYKPFENTPYRPRYNGSKPAANAQGNNNGHSNNGNGDNGNGTANVCPIHNVEMKRWERDGKVWFSHKSQDGSWCTGKTSK